MQKNFNKWNKYKKITESRDTNRDFFYHEGEIWWLVVGVNIGVEIDGKNINFERPVFILKKFNRDMFWGIPLTTSPGPEKFYYRIDRDNGVSWLILSQLKTFSSKRLVRKMGKISSSDLNKISIRIIDLIKKKT